MGWIDAMALASGLPDPISISSTPLWLLLVGMLAVSAVGIAALAVWESRSSPSSEPLIRRQEAEVHEHASRPSPRALPWADGLPPLQG
jgi:hypothetical protein